MSHLVKSIYKELTASIIFNDERLNAFFLTSGMRQCCPLTTSSQYCTANLCQCNNARKINKIQTDGKGKNKTMHFADNIIVYVGPSKLQKKKKLLEIISEFN